MTSQIKSCDLPGERFVASFDTQHLCFRITAQIGSETKKSTRKTVADGRKQPTPMTPRASKLSRLENNGVWFHNNSTQAPFPSRRNSDSVSREREHTLRYDIHIKFNAEVTPAIQMIQLKTVFHRKGNLSPTGDCDRWRILDEEADNIAMPRCTRN